MHSIAFLFKRKPGMTREEFERHYRDIHAPLSAKLPGIVEYRQHPIREGGPGDVFAGIPSGFDALSVYTFESTEAADAAWRSPENTLVEADTFNFIDVETMLTLPLILRKVV